MSHTAAHSARPALNSHPIVAVLGNDPEQLIATYMSYAHSIAGDFQRRFPAFIDRADLFGYAELGLVEAAQHFDPTKGVQFKTFAYYRIRGAIYDGLRTMGWFSKREYQRFRFERQANEYMSDSTETGDDFSSPPMDPLERTRQLAGNILTCYMLSLEAMSENGSSPYPREDDERSPETQLERKELRAEIRRCLNQLPEKYRLVLTGYYFQEKTLEQIGLELDLSKSWVCRLHAKGLEMLKQVLVRELGSNLLAF